MCVCIIYNPTRIYIFSYVIILSYSYKKVHVVYNKSIKNKKFWFANLKKKMSETIINIVKLNRMLSLITIFHSYLSIGLGI